MTAETRAVHGALRGFLVAGAAVVALSSFYVAPHLGKQLVGASTSGPGDGARGPAGGPVAVAAGPNGTKQAGTGTSSVRGGPAGGTSGGSGPAGAANLQCAPGRNGGSTDVGVDAHTIHLAATEVESGIGSSFLGPVRYGMLAVLQRVNRQGGICGRQLDLTLRDDGWDAMKGKNYLDSFIQSGQYFALAVVPSSEGLNQASLAKDIDNAPDGVTGSTGIPVVGSDGMLNSQYHDPWIWPVPASTASSMRIIARDAFNRHAKSFAIVYDSTYKFGIEGKDAYVAQIKRDGGTIDTSNCAVGLDPTLNSYGNQVDNFNKYCSNVDFVALLLEPQVAQTWLQGAPYMGKRSDGSGVGAGGPQPLFDYGFFGSCGRICINMQLWTSLFPPRYPFNQQSAVQQYQRDLAAVDSNGNDAASAFVEGGYEGMQLLVSALEKTGPDLTRTALKNVLDTQSFQFGLSASLAFKSGGHYANESMVAYSVSNSQGSGDVSYVQGSQQDDPCPSCQDG